MKVSLIVFHAIDLDTSNRGFPTRDPSSGGTPPTDSRLLEQSVRAFAERCRTRRQAVLEEKPKALARRKAEL